MKDRYKVFLTCLAIALCLTMIVLLVGFTFKKINLREYGIPLYQYFDNLNTGQTLRQNGNYIIGIDYYFHKFPAGIIPYQFTIKALTKDKTQISVNGFFAGKLIKGYILSMYQEYGNSYLAFLKASLEESFRQGIQEFSLNQLISSRALASNFITNYVKIQLQSKYQWIQVDTVSIGVIAGNIPSPQIIQNSYFIQQQYIKTLQQSIQLQKRLNIYNLGGYQMMEKIQSINSQLFKNVSLTISGVLNSSSFVDQKQRLYAANYIVNTDEYQTLNNQIKLKMSLG